MPSSRSGSLRGCGLRWTAQRKLPTLQTRAVAARTRAPRSARLLIRLAAQVHAQRPPARRRTRLLRQVRVRVQAVKGRNQSGPAAPSPSQSPQSTPRPAAVPELLLQQPRVGLAPAASAVLPAEALALALVQRRRRSDQRRAAAPRTRALGRALTLTLTSTPLTWTWTRPSASWASGEAAAFSPAVAIAAVVAARVRRAVPAEPAVRAPSALQGVLLWLLRLPPRLLVLDQPSRRLKEGPQPAQRRRWHLQCPLQHRPLLALALHLSGMPRPLVLQAHHLRRHHLQRQHQH